MNRRVAYVLALVSLLVVVQLRAEVVQVAAGFRPLGHAAKRVDFSWDMFAVPIERCDVWWDPPLSVEGKRVVHWHDRGTVLEWDTAMANIQGYEEAAAFGCDYRTAPETLVRLSCINSDMEESELQFRCP